MGNGNTRVVILNGVGSVGKSTIAKALQEIAHDSFLHVPMDSFLEMLPAKSYDTADGLTFHRTHHDGRPAVEIVTGPFAAQTFHGMRLAVRAMAEAGLNLIVDDVAAVGDICEYRNLLAGHRLSIVGVLASLPVLEARECSRGDRMVGLARAQFAELHTGIAYDLMVDTDGRTPGQCASYIAEELEL